MLVEDEVEPVNSDEDNRDWGEEDADRLGTAHNLADDIYEHVVLHREGEVEVDLVEDSHGHGQDAQEQVGDGEVDNQEILCWCWDLLGDIDNYYATIDDDAKDDQDTVHDYDDVVCHLVWTYFFSYKKGDKWQDKVWFREALWAEFNFVSPFFYAFECRSKFLFYWI